MKITIKDYKREKDNGCNINYLIEREEDIENDVMYNNIDVDINLSENDIKGLSKDEILTLGYRRAKPIAMRVFNNVQFIENEAEKPLGFKLINERFISIAVVGNMEPYVGECTCYNLEVMTQYGYKDINQDEVTWSRERMTTFKNDSPVELSANYNGQEAKTLIKPKKKDVDILRAENLMIMEMITTLFESK